MAAVVRAQFAYLPSFTRVIASSFCEGPVRGHRPKFAQLGQLAQQNKARVLVIWVCASPKYQPHADLSSRVRRTTRSLSTTLAKYET
jgi:hypothetical protein